MLSDVDIMVCSFTVSTELRGTKKRYIGIRMIAITERYVLNVIFMIMYTNMVGSGRVNPSESGANLKTLALKTNLYTVSYLFTSS